LFFCNPSAKYCAPLSPMWFWSMQSSVSICIK
jgi:hypothetical protein